MLGSSGLEKRRPRGDLAAPRSSLKGGTEGDAGLCSLRPGIQGRPGLSMRKKFFTIRVIKHWHRLPNKVGAALGLSVFRRHLGTALSDVLLLSPGAVSQLGLTVSIGPFQLNFFILGHGFKHLGLGDFQI